MLPADPSDTVAITQVVQRYFEALDEKRYERLEQVFAPDAVLRYSLDESTGPPLPVAAMTARIRGFNTCFRFTQHLGGPTLVDVEVDTARARTNLRALHVQHGRDGVVSTWIVHGVYSDRLARTAAGWRITERIFRVVATEGILRPASEVEIFDTPPWR